MAKRQKTFKRGDDVAVIDPKAEGGVRVLRRARVRKASGYFVYLDDGSSWSQAGRSGMTAPWLRLVLASDVPAGAVEDGPGAAVSNGAR